MKKRQSVALVAAGKLSDSPVMRFWGLRERLGPVKSSSLRLASRMVNNLHAGQPVKDWDRFAHCSLILISAPDEAVPRIVSELAGSGISWHSRTVVLCSTLLDGSVLSPLAVAGASVGTITAIPGFEDLSYLIEGNAHLIRQARPLLKRRGTKILAIQPPLKPFFLAALTCTSTVFYSLLIATAECLRQTGLLQTEASSILQKQIEKTLRSYLVGGRKSFPVLKELDGQLAALAVVQPVIAEYFQETTKLAVDLPNRLK